MSGRSLEEFEFLASDEWSKYTHQKYLPLKDIAYRSNLPDQQQKTKCSRKMGAIPFFLKTIRKKFWYYPADCINNKIHQIENLGHQLYQKIGNHQTFRTFRAFKCEFLADSTIEEAASSAIYEGANATMAQAQKLIQSGHHPQGRDERMLVNTYSAMKWIKEHRSLPLSSELILKIHEIISRNTLEGDDANFCGKFRNDAVYVGRHQGLAHHQIKEALEEVIERLSNHPRSIRPLLKGILLHYFIAYIHPFFDGNGRTARTLFYFETMKNDLKFVELLSISANLKNHGKKYSQSFDLVKKHDWDMTFFIDFSLDSLLSSLKKIQEKVDFLLRLSTLGNSMGINDNQIALLQKMALQKYKTTTIEKYAQSINKSREMARRELGALAKMKLLHKQKQGKKFVYLVNAKYLKEMSN